MTMGNTVRQEHIPIPTQTTKHDKYLGKTSQVVHHHRNIYMTET